MAAKKKLPDQLGIIPIAADRENTVSVGGKTFPMRKDQAARFKVASAPPPSAPADAAEIAARPSRGRGGRALFDAAARGDSGLPQTTAAVPMDRPNERGTKTVSGPSAKPVRRKTVVAKTPTKTFAMTRPAAAPAAAAAPGRQRITKASVDKQVAHQRQLYAKNHPPKKKTSRHDFSGLKWFR